MHAFRPFQPAGHLSGPVLTTGALLVVSIGLAATLVWARGLGDPVHIDGWSIIFRPPRGWQGDPPVAIRHGGTLIKFREPTSGRTSRQVTFSQHPNRHHLPPDGVCRALTGPHVGALAALVPVERVLFGPLPGARISLPAGACIYAGVLVRPDRAGEAYAFEFLSNQPLTAQDMQLCEALARAIRFAD